MATTALVLVAATVVSLWQNVQLSHARTEAADNAATATEQAVRALREAESSERILGFVIEMFEERSADRLQGSTLTVKEVLDDQAARLRGELGDEPEARGRLMSTRPDRRASGEFNAVFTTGFVRRDSRFHRQGICLVANDLLCE